MSIGSFRNWLEKNDPFDENVYDVTVCEKDVDTKMEQLVSVLKSMHNKSKTETAPYKLSDIQVEEIDAERFLFGAAKCTFREANEAETLFNLFTSLWCIREYAKSLDMLLTIFTMNKEKNWNFFVSVKFLFSEEVQKSVQYGLAMLSADNNLFLHPNHTFLVVEVNPGFGKNPLICEPHVAVTNNYDKTKAMYALRCAVVYTGDHFIFVTYDEHGEMNGGWDDDHKLVREGQNMKVINDTKPRAPYPIPFLKENVFFVLYEKDRKRESELLSPSSLPSKLQNSVVIGDYTFQLLCKCEKSERMYVKIKSLSANSNKTNEFSVYSSLSELGLWRLCLKSGLSLYKGNTDSKYYDYAQATLIHLDLQKYITEKLNVLTVDQVAAECTKLIYGDETSAESYKYIGKSIDTLYRPTYVEPFATFNKKQYIKQGKSIPIPIPNANRCGDPWKRKHMEELKLLSKDLTAIYSVQQCIKLYTVDKSLGVQVKGTTWKFTYDVYLVSLRKKTFVPKKDKGVIFLMFAHVKNFESVSIGEKKVLLKKENVFWPFGLTLNLRCTELGLYETFISSGKYICKFAEYSSQIKDNDNFTQISFDPSASVFKQDPYFYIADIYQDLFPFPEVRAMLGV